MLDWALGPLKGLLGFAGDAVGSAVGWAWDKVIGGIYTWLAKGLALLIEWVWSVLDASTTPRLSESWFRRDLMGRVGLIALTVTIAMMLASAIQAALAGRPEQITDAVKGGVRAIVASALTVTIIVVLIGVTDEAATQIWQVGRADLVTTLERMVTITMATGPLGQTFIGPLCLLFGYVGLLGLAVALFMRNALIYLAAALAPIVWSTSVLPMFRGSAHKLVHLTVSLILSKLAIVITLVVAVKLVANTGGDAATNDVVKDGAAAVGTLVSGFVCFLIAAITPYVLYKLMPTVEGAAVASGIAGGWSRSATTTAHTALMAKSLGASAATRSVAGQRAATAGADTTTGGASAVGALAIGSLATGGNPPRGGGRTVSSLPQHAKSGSDSEPTATPDEGGGASMSVPRVQESGRATGRATAPPSTQPASTSRRPTSRRRRRDPAADEDVER